MNARLLKNGFAALLFPCVLAAASCGAQKECYYDGPPYSPEDAGTAACPTTPTTTSVQFGIPAPMTGLTYEQCKPEVSSGTGASTRYFTGLYTPAQIDRLETMVLSETSPHKAKLPYLPTDLDDNPWDHPDLYTFPSESTVCGLKIVNAANPNAIIYSLETYASKASAEAAGARVTNLGICGHCSSLSDLAKLLRIPDRAYRVRQCAIKSLTDGKEAVYNCIKEFGLTDNCAMIWYYNAMYTYNACLGRCAKLAEANYHTASGELNDCMMCNSEKADALFKLLAGRRDDGQPISMCRQIPEDEWICHNYADHFDDPYSCIGIGAPKQKWNCTLDDYNMDTRDYDLEKCVFTTE